MSGTLTLAAGQVFTGGTLAGTGDTGQVAFVDAGIVTFDTTTTPVSRKTFEITQDTLASSQPFLLGTLDTFTITSVTHNTMFPFTQDDMPGPFFPPPGYDIFQTDIGTVIGLQIVSSQGTFNATTSIIGTDGSLALTGVIEIMLPLETIEANVTAVLSLNSQTTGNGLSEIFAPASVEQVACFAKGTLIDTPEGEVTVEALRERQNVLLACGGSGPVRWLAHRAIDCQHHPRPADVWPVRITAGAFAPMQPRRDLLLSPSHAIFADGHLIPVRCLINGTTIVQEAVARITYWHVELASHGVILAEGLPCESYLDTGNRAAFESDGVPEQGADAKYSCMLSFALRAVAPPASILPARASPPASAMHDCRNPVVGHQHEICRRVAPRQVQLRTDGAIGDRQLAEAEREARPGEI